MITIRAQVVNLAVKARVIKEQVEGGTLEHIEPVARLTLEFDGEAVADVQQIIDLIGDRPVLLGLTDSQSELPFAPAPRDVVRVRGKAVDRPTGEVME